MNISRKISTFVSKYQKYLEIFNSVTRLRSTKFAQGHAQHWKINIGETRIDRLFTFLKLVPKRWRIKIWNKKIWTKVKIWIHRRKFCFHRSLKKTFEAKISKRKADCCLLFGSIDRAHQEYQRAAEMLKSQNDSILNAGWFFSLTSDRIESSFSLRFFSAAIEGRVVTHYLLSKRPKRTSTKSSSFLSQSSLGRSNFQAFPCQQNHLHAVFKDYRWNDYWIGTVRRLIFKRNSKMHYKFMRCIVQQQILCRFDFNWTRQSDGVAFWWNKTISK